jgi:hypothetical protein
VPEHFIAKVKKISQEMSRCLSEEQQANMTIIVGGLHTFSLEPELTELVNQPREKDVIASLSILVATVAVNLAAARVLQQKDDNAINRIIIIDCLINVVTMVTVGSIGWQKLNLDFLCSTFLFFEITLITWNRLVPVGIGVFRYLLVCT